MANRDYGRGRDYSDRDWNRGEGGGYSGRGQDRDYDRGNYDRSGYGRGSDRGWGSEDRDLGRGGYSGISGRDIDRDRDWDRSGNRGYESSIDRDRERGWSGSGRDYGRETLGGSMGRDLGRTWDRDRDRERGWSGEPGGYERGREWNAGGTNRDRWQGSEYRTDYLRNEYDYDRGGERNREDWNRAQWDQGDWNRGSSGYRGQEAGYGGMSGGMYGNRDFGVGSSRDWTSGAQGSSYGYGRGSEALGGQYGGRFGGQFGGQFGASGYAGAGMSQDAYRRSYYGRGPRNFRRSDERIREEINERLTRHPEIDASDVDVQVMNGDVVLSGVVEDRTAKRLAEDIVEDIYGVSDVQNNLKVRHGFLAGLTGEKADEREIQRTATREGGTAATGATSSNVGTATQTSGATRARSTATPDQSSSTVKG